MNKERLKNGLEKMGIAADETALDRFEAFHAILDEYNARMDLTAVLDEDERVDRHDLDSAAPLAHGLLMPGAKVIDVGTGAGFPGLPLAILRPDADFTLLDSQQKRIDFIAETAALLGLENTHCEAMRAEEAPRGLHEGFDIAVSRAVARLNVLCELCLPFVRVGGSFISMKAADCAEEVAEAAKAIETLGGSAPEIRTYTIPGTDVVRTAVIIKKTAPTPAKYPRRWARISKQPL